MSGASERANGGAKWPTTLTRRFQSHPTQCATDRTSGLLFEMRVIRADSRHVACDRPNRKGSVAFWSMMLERLSRARTTKNDSRSKTNKRCFVIPVCYLASGLSGSNDSYPILHNSNGGSFIVRNTKKSTARSFARTARSLAGFALLASLAGSQ